MMLATAACSSPAPPPPPPPPPTKCPGLFVGDATKSTALELIGLGPNMNAVPIDDGSMVTLAFPPQGGRVIFAGVRATNLDPCAVQLGGVVRDETTKQVRLDSRTVNLKPTGDGWAASDPTDISTFANVPVCPNEWSKTNLYGTEYELEVDLTDSKNNTTSKIIKVIPECAEPAHAADCLCICMGGYMLGQSCADAGATDAGTPDAGDGGP
jgi:hypothetical protein